MDPSNNGYIIEIWQILLQLSCYLLANGPLVATKNIIIDLITFAL
jgi:hypothetical protein